METSFRLEMRGGLVVFVENGFDRRASRETGAGEATGPARGGDHRHHDPDKGEVNQAWASWLP